MSRQLLITSLGLGGPRPGHRLRPRWVLTALSLFGTAYFIGMLFRGWLGRLERYDGGWLDEPLPTLFYLVLAAFVLVATHREWTEEQREPGRSALAEMVSVAIYPATISTGLLLYAALQASGVAIGIVAYPAVAIATVTILGAERLRPARPQCQPERNNAIFGTRFLLSGRRVTQLGLINRSHPYSLVGQTTSLFVPGLDKHPITTGRGAKPSNR